MPDNFIIRNIRVSKNIIFANDIILSSSRSDFWKHFQRILRNWIFKHYLAVPLIVRWYARKFAPRHSLETASLSDRGLCNAAAIAVVRCIRGSLKCLSQLPVSQRGEARMGTKSSSSSVITIVRRKCIVGFSPYTASCKRELASSGSITPDIFELGVVANSLFHWLPPRLAMAHRKRERKRERERERERKSVEAGGRFI